MGKINSGMMSSSTDLWSTPQWLFDRLNNHFEFKIDVCATVENTKCKKYFDIKQNGLIQEWNETWWCNPPYGKEIEHWVRKAAESNTTGIMLLPSRTDPKWIQKYVFPKANEVLFFSGRLKFGNSKNSAPFPSCLAIYNNVGLLRFQDLGIVMQIKKPNGV